MHKSQNCRILLLLMAVAGCSNAEQPERFGFEVSGRLEHGKIREASGLARSYRQPGVLWIINDNGAQEIVHAIDGTGARQGEFDLRKSRNVDWEDLASFEVDGAPYLMIADIGDNDAKRPYRTLYFVKEPRAKRGDSEKLDWRVDFRYPDGPRDAESAAIDTDAGQALVLSKRDIPARLYSLPLRWDGDEPVVAEFLGVILSLPKPSRQEVASAPKTKDWGWQPVGMDISHDGRAAVILTYRAVYYYQRRDDQTWIETLNDKPARIGLGNFRNAEAIAFGNKHREVFVTGENKNSRVLRIDLSEIPSQ